MARGTASRSARSTGVLPLLAGITSALALTGAAVYTVGQAGCVEPGQYVRHDNHIELVGGCVDGNHLPQKGTGQNPSAASGTGPSSNYQQ
ncbi:hypothetical protein ABZ863_25090 [Saccharomonospora sp. NPDC046836]|uniref:hypothetical protein n=1 Tax=Saccharomonospora sp. NPDC046836 TaxID=3156921 RepID=UPI00340A33E8